MDLSGMWLIWRIYKTTPNKKTYETYLYNKNTKLKVFKCF